MINPLNLVSFKIESNKIINQADFFERAASICLTPLRMSTGHRVIVIDKNSIYRQKQQTVTKISRVVYVILALLLFPLTIAGIVFCKLSKTHAYHYQQFQNQESEKLHNHIFYQPNQELKKLDNHISSESIPSNSSPSDSATRLLKERNLLIKMIGKASPIAKKFSRHEILGDGEWDYLVEQLKDPEGTRQMRRAKTDDELSSKKMVKFTYDYEKEILTEKGRENFYQGTAKTSTTLLPADCKMNLFSNPRKVGLLFDVTKCQFKTNYLFSSDFVSLSKWWKRLYPAQEVKKKTSNFLKNLRKDQKDMEKTFLKTFPKFDSLSQLQEKLAEQEMTGTQIPHYNEILVSVNKESIEGVACISKDLSAKVFAISRQIYLEKELGLKKDIYFIDSNEGLTLYPKSEQVKDLTSLLNSSSSLTEFQQELQKVFTNPYATDASVAFSENQTKELIQALLNDLSATG